MSYRLEHNPEMVFNLDQLSLEEITQIQSNLIEKADKLMNDIRTLGEAATAKVVENSLDQWLNS